MAVNAANVRVGKPLATGGFSIDTTGAAAAPTDAKTALGAGWSALGYVSDSGVTQSMATDVQEIRAWGGDVVRKVQTSHDLTYSLVLIETSDSVTGFYYGNATTAAGLTTIEVTGAELEHTGMCFDIRDGDNAVRVHLPDGQITERGDVVYQDAEAIGYEVTITAYPDEDGVKAYIYSESTAE